MSLKEELKTLQTRLEAGRPVEVVAAMHRAVDDLRTSGAARRMLAVGDRGPEFALPGAGGGLVESKRLLERRPLVVTFYRGRAPEWRRGPRQITVLEYAHAGGAGDRGGRRGIR